MKPSTTYQAYSGVVLFSSGSQFLVCKREVIDGMTHVYLREIELGLSKNVVLLCDDKVSTSWILAE